ncbi:hypothetical protein SAMN06265337_1883 [Hymenobacter gelipurpurascens]|uniref:SpoIIAA-like n=1 Tax=Hymenobacter gelipurpurascens TaxID=89968 RepID=A0A212TMF9_9BACT|nr:hypothetical protein [Hymenobacter gelipurpurascens]SNC67237.1 hypothetical protein SAMN06265337_1883 [Hymenobacter gelipurpurascens]
MSSVHFQSLGTLFDEHGSHLVDIEYASAQGVLRVQWFGNITGREVIYVAEEFVKLQKQLHAPFLLNDKSQATGDWVEAMEWLEYEWLPQAITGGLQAVAYVFSPELGNQFASVEFAERVSQHIPIKLFYDVPSAWQWLRGQARTKRPASNPLPPRQA